MAVPVLVCSGTSALQKLLMVCARYQEFKIEEDKTEHYLLLLLVLSAELKSCLAGAECNCCI